MARAFETGDIKDPFRRARLASIRGDTKGALRQYRAAIEERPGGWLFDGARAAAKAGDTAQAVAWLRELLPTIKRLPPRLRVANLAMIRAHVDLKPLRDEPFWAELDALYREAAK